MPPCLVYANVSVKYSAIHMFGYSEEELLGQFTAVVYESQEEYERQGRERYNLTAEEKLSL